MPFFNNLFAHCEKTRNSDSQKIFSSNQLFRNPLLSRNFCQKCVRENSRNFHIVICKHILSHWKFREVNWFRTANWFHENLSESIRFRKFYILTYLHFAFIRERCVPILDFWFSFFSYFLFTFSWCVHNFLFWSRHPRKPDIMWFRAYFFSGLGLHSLL